MKFENHKIGRLGEDLAIKHLLKSGFTILDRNFSRPWGEIDIIAMKRDVIYFLEVKTVSYETVSDFHQNLAQGFYLPEQRVSEAKLDRLQKIIETWLQKQDTSHLCDVDITALSVHVILADKVAIIDSFYSLKAKSR